MTAVIPGFTVSFSLRSFEFFLQFTGFFVRQRTPLWLHLAAMYEKRCVDGAALVVMNNEPARLAMQELYPHRAEPFGTGTGLIILLFHMLLTASKPGV